jgi:hypothetical protein
MAETAVTVHTTWHGNSICRAGVNDKPFPATRRANLDDRPQSCPLPIDKGRQLSQLGMIMTDASGWISPRHTCCHA